MRWGTIENQGSRTAAVLWDKFVITMEALNQETGFHFATELETVIREGQAAEVDSVLTRNPGVADKIGVAESSVRVLAPLSNPERIVGIGLNYRDHASDLSEQVPEEPATFMKSSSCIIGPEDSIEIPQVSERTTAEAEIALIFGRDCRDVSPEDWQSVIFGLVPVLDMTTEDILRRNPRFLTRSKGFDTFFSMGPWIVTLDELPDLKSLYIETVVNGQVRAGNGVAAMAYGFPELVRFITSGVSVGATAVLSTGTPGAFVLRPGDQVEARVSDVGTLKNTVRNDAKKKGP